MRQMQKWGSICFEYRLNKIFNKNLFYFEEPIIYRFKFVTTESVSIFLRFIRL